MAYGGKSAEEMLHNISKKLDRLDDVVEKLDQVLRVISLTAIGDRSTTEAANLLKTAGLDTASIADLLNTSPAAIRSYLQRGKKS